ncbi:DUF3243 domain-containing protein [Macrococcus brunensis]|uniref:DUF3243 domain-containing protein n=1 Tax=Macrococcus brunensis TaxID=198483 RepID=UPI001EEFD367|nr:DUF3243 domain-containing protein [Macrococcus brunensis]ULG72719.1 DUF3243 domain-containing protein [Macrococcus brunensis]ULG74967.1 DUF3243 domain-containing protein [Macrococcus brunensis]
MSNLNPEQAVNNLSQEEKDQILESFNQFTSYLGSKVEKAEKLGFSEETVAKAAEKVADHLAKNEEPKNREEKVLNELWNNAEGEEKSAIARALVRMVSKEA